MGPEWEVFFQHLNQLIQMIDDSLPAFWFVAQFRPRRGTNPDNEMQQNKGNSAVCFAPFCTRLYGLLGRQLPRYLYTYSALLRG